MTISPYMRANLFIWMCVPFRLYIAWLPQENKHLKLLGIGLAFISIINFYLYVTNSRLNAYEGGGNTWWSKFRILHSLLYAIASVMLFQNNINASIPLALDVIIGIILFFTLRLKLPK